MSFKRATTVFRDSYAISRFDDEHSEDEERWITIGQDSGGILLVVFYMFRETKESQCHIIIISTRKANKKEAAQYRV